MSRIASASAAQVCQCDMRSMPATLPRLGNPFLGTMFSTLAVVATREHVTRHIPLVRHRTVARRRRRGLLEELPAAHRAADVVARPGPRCRVPPLPPEEEVEALHGAQLVEDLDAERRLDHPALLAA